ncbi:MAG: NUDIX domain-containing protein [Candidatus Gracilibacteria bacterium]|nr:NUDIX domain-containing protein [Candidatus Gracilibacteria bacterium]
MGAKEFVYLVGENDEVLGYKSRDELTDDDTWRIIAVNIYDESGEYILVQQRSKLKKLNPGLWTLAVVGTVEKDDTYESCAIREVKEEIGVDCIDLVEVTKIYYKATLGHRFCSIFSDIIPKDTTITIQEDEVDIAKWIHIDELKIWVENKPEEFTKYTIEIWKYLGVL